jgi:FAD binding domain
MRTTRSAIICAILSRGELNEHPHVFLSSPSYDARGATGLPAAIVACEAGCSVILVEAEKDIGGHAIISGGNVPLGGGTSVQKKYGIADSPDLLFRDLTDWSVVGPNGFPDYRYKRPRDHRRLCRQQRRDLRMAARGALARNRAHRSVGRRRAAGGSAESDRHQDAARSPSGGGGAGRAVRSTSDGRSAPIPSPAGRGGPGKICYHEWTPVKSRARTYLLK